MFCWRQVPRSTALPWLSASSISSFSSTRRRSRVRAPCRSPSPQISNRPGSRMSACTNAVLISRSRLICGRCKKCSCSVRDAEHGRARNRVVLEVIQRVVGVAQRINLHVGLNRDSRCDAKKIVTILPRIVGDATNHSLLIQQVVAERWNRAHVYPTEHQYPALSECL